MKINLGQKIYYMGRGPCVVDALIRKSVCGVSAMFYNFTLLDESGADFLVPVGSCPDLPLRSLIAREQIPSLLRRLQPRADAPTALASWHQRHAHSSKLFSSGSAFDLADAIESLTRSSATRKLAMDEWETLRRARKLLICEIAEVMNETTAAAEGRLECLTNPDKKSLKKLGNRFNFTSARRAD